MQVEQYGFDEEVNVMVQPKAGFVDYPSTGIESETKYRVYQNVKFSQKLYLPAESDVLVSFAPVRNLPENAVGLSYMGRFRLRCWY